MKQFVISFLILLGIHASNSIFAQNNNRLSIQTGLFHCFFDGSPILNLKYQNKNIKPFRGALYNSLGVQYLRKISEKDMISLEYAYFYKYYRNAQHDLSKNVVSDRGYNTFNTTYERALSLKSNFTYTYGGGLTYRYGSEYVLINHSNIGCESLLETRNVKDFGVNIRTGIEYSPLKWLTLYSKFDFISFVYMYDKKTIKKLQDVYGYKEYPHNFDLSWRFGLGFNFGK